MIKVSQLDPKTASANTILSLGKAFIKVFSTDPAWEEFWKCPRCNASFPESDTSPECFHCAQNGYNVPITEYWTMTKVLEDFYTEMSKENAICIIATNEEEEIVGFCWGYFLNVNPSLEEHLGAEGLIGSLEKSGLSDTVVAYQDEIAVIPEYQKQGIAKKLFMERHRHFHSIAPEGTVFFRTLSKPTKSVTYTWMIDKIGYQVIHEIENEHRTRVIARHSVSEVQSYIESNY